MNTSDTTSINHVASDAIPSNTVEPAWLLKASSAPKLGKHAQGAISYPNKYARNR